MLQFSELLGFSSLKSWKVGTAMNDWCDPFPSSVTLITRFEDGLGFKSLRWFAMIPEAISCQTTIICSCTASIPTCVFSPSLLLWRHTSGMILKPQQGQSLAVFNWQEGWCGVMKLCFLRGLGSESHGKLRLSFPVSELKLSCKS